MNNHEKMNYVEFSACDLVATKTFFESAFGWVFQDYGPEYTTFNDQGLEGGFFKTDKAGTQATGGALIVFFSKHLLDTQERVKAAGGVITQDTYEFPGGKRFHFIEPSGNEFAVWGQL